MGDGIRVAALLVAAALTATACTDSGPNTRPTSVSTPSTSRPAKPAPPNRNLRDVTKAMIYSDGIAYVLPETAAQMICGALSPADWSEILGSMVGRSVSYGVDTPCVVDTGVLSVKLSMTVETLGQEGERINGRRVRVDAQPPNAHSAYAAAAVVTSGEQDISAQQQISANPVLRLQAQAADLDQPAPDLPALLRRLLTVLLPRLTPADRPATPAYDSARKLAYTPTEPVAGVPIYDLPRTVQSLVLCTVVLRETGIKAIAAGPHVNSVGECSIDEPRIFAEVDQFSPAVPESRPDRIAGRPAIQDSSGMVINLLTTPADYGRSKDLTLRLYRDLPSVELRRWAEKVANALLAGS